MYGVPRWKEYEDSWLSFIFHRCGHPNYQHYAMPNTHIMWRLHLLQCVSAPLVLGAFALLVCNGTLDAEGFTSSASFTGVRSTPGHVHMPSDMAFNRAPTSRPPNFSEERPVLAVAWESISPNGVHPFSHARTRPILVLKLASCPGKVHADLET